MIPELGALALCLALAFAGLQSGLAFAGISKARLDFQNAASRLTFATAFFVLFAYACLTWSFYTVDLTVRYVALHASAQLPWLYRVCAVWGGHEGSMLLWTVMLCFWMTLFALVTQAPSLKFKTAVLGVLGGIVAGFLLFILITSNPFLRVFMAVPQTGRDLNPLLQDIGFLLHPTMLYMGYVGFALVFAIAVAILAFEKPGTRAFAQIRPWTLAAWSCLTLGITLGSWWAYRELGWGGWWFWDPVENASFLPWLVGTALLHANAVSVKRKSFQGWTLMLALISFSLSLLGTFLVRSGILTSVHAFAVDPKRGIFILGLLFIVIAGSLLLFACRAPRFYQPPQFNLISRETFLLLNTVILTVAMLTVLLGTLYPLIIQILGLGKLSVGAPYFNRVFVPLMIPVLFLMGLGPLAAWGQARFEKQRFVLIGVFGVCLFLGTVLPVLYGQAQFIYGVLGLALAFWIVLTSWPTVKTLVTQRPFQWSKLSMLLAHLGVAVTAIGIALSAYYSAELQVQMRVGDHVALGPYVFQMKEVSQHAGPNYRSHVVHFVVREGNRVVTEMAPQKRIYTVRQQAMSEAAVDATVTRDLYLALGEPLGAGQWTLRLYYKPFVRWIWAGGLLMLLGGLAGLLGVVATGFACGGLVNPLSRLRRPLPHGGEA